MGEWTDYEKKTALRMHRDGYGNAEIGAVLRRHPAAVRVWLHHKMKVERLSTPSPKVAIDQVDVISWYLLGWRFIGFDGSRCIMEWQNLREPRYPAPVAEHSQERALEAA